MGPQNSATSTALLDATERVLHDHGYGAVTSRRVAAEAGLKQQLVYYYFRTMDELLLATLNRRIQQMLDQLERALDTDRPARDVWSDLARSLDAGLAFEFLAMANHHDGVRDAVRTFVNRARDLQTRAMTAQLERRGIDPSPLTPAALVFIVHSAMLLMSREADLEIVAAHDDVLALGEWALRLFD
jgi:AcrR family transcriptional regulator